MEKSGKILVILAIIAMVSLSISFIILKSSIKTVEIHVVNFCNETHTIYIKVWGKNQIFIDENLTIKPNKVIKFAFLTDERSFIVKTKIDGIVNEKKVKGWLISINIIKIKDELKVDIESLG